MEINIALSKPYHGEMKSLRYISFVLTEKDGEIEVEQDFTVIRSIECPTQADKMDMKARLEQWGK